MSEQTIKEMLKMIDAKIEHIEDITADNRAVIIKLVKQSNQIVKFLSSIEIEDFIKSLKLCGRIFVDKPTAIPSTPWLNIRGKRTGNDIGSLFLPSYEDWYSVIFLLNKTSRAKSVSLASM